MSASPRGEGSADKHSRVTFDVASYQGGVRLSVTHDELEPGSEMEKGDQLRLAARCRT